MTDPVRRVHYYSGQLLTPEDFQSEQDYHRSMRYLHNRLLGHGVVHGLGITVGNGPTVVVSPGLAVDACGREIVLAEEVHVEVREPSDPDGALDVTATWAQEPDSFVVPVEGTDEPPFTRWLERPQLALVPAGEAAAESVVLGRVLFSGGEVTAVDTSGRSAWQRAESGS
ncbi:hypothetical protein ACPPVT_12505 [Angustibacter sp. McL0619]|uniref:hypothetical protein n=1 Tax=Angustibacter sp. McL0619 TaxID=3415676 RepID=UPI003CE937C4